MSAEPVSQAMGLARAGCLGPGLGYVRVQVGHVVLAAAQHELLNISRAHGYPANHEMPSLLPACPPSMGHTCCAPKSAHSCHWLPSSPEKKD